MTPLEYQKKYGREQLICVCGHKNAVHFSTGCKVCYPCAKFKAAPVQPEEPPKVGSY